ncbi:hypothetical protein [Rhodococcus qingshengii]|uniref:hypothetical protein n=1 Tax=Rhodococcus qingshengii TaxID=334542 RepID=UPI001F225F19|nr:hypothetical protein [Rhodococcus qingshengii]
MRGLIDQPVGEFVEHYGRGISRSRTYPRTFSGALSTARSSPELGRLSAPAPWTEVDGLVDLVAVQLSSRARSIFAAAA